jgi:vancomycin resistance protein YoaR
MHDHPQRQTFNPWLIRLPLLFILGALLFVGALVAAVFFFQAQYSERIMPGVSAYGVALGGMTPAEAAAALEARFTYDDDAVFTFRDGDQFWQLTAGELGITFDAAGAVEQAASAGRTGSPLVDPIEQALIWLNGRPISPLVRYDQNVAVARLADIAATINIDPQDAALVVQGTEVLVTQGRSGRTVDILATLSRLETAILSLSTGAEVPLVISETPPRIRDVDAAAAKARTALASPIQLIADDPATGGSLGPWTANVDQIARLLRLELLDNGDGTYRYDVYIDMAIFGSFLETLAPGLIIAPQDARFHFNDETGQLEAVRRAVNGRQLNVAETLARMEAGVFDSGNRTIMMAFDYTLPRYHNDITAAELGITELVSEATTYFTGSTQPRRENISVAADRFDGIIIAPGEEFSFNRYVGDISPEEGYVESKVILGGRTIDGVGGGVCQVSTTAFQAAFYAGFPILERYAHGYRVGYYDQGEGVGMDAAIYTPDLDFRFLNDTDYHLLIETAVFPAENTVQFRFYSTNPGRRVIKEGPVLENVQPPAATRYEVNPNLRAGEELWVDWAAEGAQVTVTRIILDENGNRIDEDRFVSRYQPWGAIVQVPPGDTRAS